VQFEEEPRSELRHTAGMPKEHRRLPKLQLSSDEEMCQTRKPYFTYQCTSHHYTIFLRNKKANPYYPDWLCCMFRYYGFCPLDAAANLFNRSVTRRLTVPFLYLPLSSPLFIFSPIFLPVRISVPSSMVFIA